jgi:murein DD-endopeptidase MepM/ murein hydrolase activator NlpD
MVRQRLVIFDDPFDQNVKLSMKASKFRRRTVRLTVVVILLLISTYLIFRFYSSPVSQNTDPYVYELPYAKGSRHKIIQGYGGLFSHYHVAALDFEMPEGTPIHAAREGNVYSYRDNNREGGPFSKYKRKANYIMIQHPDGSIGCYWHLKQHGVVVKKGAVAKGQLIGYSGNTGFTLRPHLHFSVKRVLSYDADSYLRTMFKTSNGITFLSNGEKYTRPVE